jgi:hypothetical protein
MIGGRHTEGPRHVISHKAGSEKSIPWGFEFILWRRKAFFVEMQCVFVVETQGIASLSG